MAKKPPVPGCSEEDRRTLETWARSRSMEARLVECAKIIIGCLEGKPVNQIARDLPEFSVKAADIIGLYMSPPENALGPR